MNTYQIHQIRLAEEEEEGINMIAHNNAKTSKIAHAMAYIDTFMLTNDPDESELKEIFEQAHTLSSQEVVLIIKETAKRSRIFGIKTILREMDLPEFTQFINRKLDLFREQLLED